MPKFKLTMENYYDPKRPHLSQSRLKDYMKSPLFYKAKHIDGKLKKDTTSAMLIGKYFDALLSSPEEALKYYKQEKRGDTSPYALSEKEYEEAHTLAREVKRHEFWYPTKNTSFQVLLEAAILDDGTWVKVQNLKKGQPHVLVCGLIDRLDLGRTMDGTKPAAYIIDFKRSNPHATSSPRSWFFHCLDMGYDYQFVMYRKLVSLHYEIDERNIRCLHLVVCMDDGYPYIALRELRADYIDGKLEDLTRAAWNIKNGWFPEKRLTWDSVELCEPSSQAI